MLTTKKFLFIPRCLYSNFTTNHVHGPTFVSLSIPSATSYRVAALTNLLYSECKTEIKRIDVRFLTSFSR